MKFWFMRHGFAGLPEPVARDERLRPLIDPGTDQAVAVAREMLLRDEVPNTILCSTLTRSVQTASIVGQILGIAHVYPVTALVPHTPIHNFVQDILDENAMKRVMICGHSDRINAFFRRTLDVDLRLDFGEVVKVEIDRDDMRASSILWRLNPTDLGTPDMRGMDP